MTGPNAAYYEAICALTNAQNQLSLQITHETTVAREFVQSDNALNLDSAFGSIADMAHHAASSPRSRMTQSGHELL